MRLLASVALCFAVSLSAAPLLAQRAAPAFEAPLRQARAAYAAGRVAAARTAFVSADAAIGEERWDDEGNSLYTDAERTARESMRCPWGLSALASLGPRPEGGDALIDDSSARSRAESGASFGCGPAEQAVLADLLGVPLAAALRLEEAGITAFPAPFASRPLPPEARAFARAHSGDTLPPARDLEEARRFLLAHVVARHGIRSSCAEPRGIAWTRPGQDLALPDWDSDDELPVPPAPFTGSAPDALARVRCEYPPNTPPEEQGFGDGETGIAFLLRREPSGTVRVVASFDDFPGLDCWTGVVQGELANYSVAMPGGSYLYVFERTQGFEGFDPDEAAFVTRTATVCDLTRGACRSLPLAVRRTAVVVRGDDWVPVRSSWTSRLAIARGRVRVSSVRGAPALMRRFGRGVPLDAFFSSDSTSAEERHLFPEGGTPQQTRATSSDCPWQIADSDGQTNVRPTPSSSGAPVGTIATGTVIVAVERRGRWWRIDAPVAGWIWAPNVRQVCP